MAHHHERVAAKPCTEDGPDAREIQGEEQNSRVCYVNIRLGVHQKLMQYSNYVYSVIVGFVAITYGSVPMYKMVHPLSKSLLHNIPADSY
jgi:hypothetical protein